MAKRGREVDPRWEWTEPTGSIRPPRSGQSDFTSMNDLRITIGGEPFDHLVYHFVLPSSVW